MGEHTVQIRAELVGLEQIEAKFNSFVNKTHKVKVEVDSSGIKNDLDKIFKEYGKSSKITPDIDLSKIQKAGKEVQAIQKRMTSASLKDAYWKQTFNNTTGSIGKKSSELQQMSTFYKQQEKEAQEIVKAQSKLTDAQNRLSSAKMQRRYDSYNDVGISTKELNEAYTSTKKLEAEIDSLNRKRNKNGSLENSEALRQVEAQKELADSYKLVGKELDILQTKYGKATTLQDRKNLFNDIGSWAKENSKALKVFGADLENLQAQALEATTAFDKNRIKSEFQGIQKEASAQGLLGRSPLDEAKNMFSKFGSWFSVSSLVMGGWQQIKSAVSELKEVDTTLTEISKTSDLTSSQLKQLGNDAFESASKYGKKANDYLVGVQEMYRAGFDNAPKLAELSTLAQAAGDLDADLANDYLIASDAAYGYQGNVEKLNALLDSQNQITNRNAVSMEELARATKVAGNQLSNSGIKENEASALLGTGIATTRESGETVGRAIKGIIMNLQQVEGETGFDGEIIDAEGLKKVEARCHSLGVELEFMKDGMATLRNPMEVLKELSEVYRSLPEDSADRAGLISDIGGKYRGNFRNITAPYVQQCA